MMPSVTELSYFLEVTNVLNLSLASKNLGISQPTLSRAMQSLEAMVGTDLLIRHKKGVTLTPAGKKILLQTKPLLQNWQSAKLQALAAHEEVQGHIKIGCYSAVGGFLHGIIAELLEKYPKLNLELLHDYSDEVTQQVIDLNVDIGIVSHPIQYPDLIIRKICDTETTLWIGAGTSKLQNLNSGEAVLICHPEAIHTSLMMQQCKLANINFDRIMKVGSIEVIAHLTANGCGIGLLPSCYLQSMYPDKLKRIPDAPVIKDELHLIYRKEHLNVQAIKTVIETIKTWCSIKNM